MMGIFSVSLMSILPAVGGLILQYYMILDELKNHPKLKLNGSTTLSHAFTLLALLVA